MLLVIGGLLLFTSVMLMITRNNYTRIVKLIDKGEKEAIERRVEEWGEMIINNVQQECLERKLSLTLFVFLLPVFSLLLIVFSIYKLDMMTYLIISVIHLTVLLIIYLILKRLTRKKKKKLKEE